jgi:hypothetical protein
LNKFWEEFKVEAVDKKLRRYKSNWLRHAAVMNSNRITEIMLNCRPDGRRGLGSPMKRLSYEVETGLSRSNW